MFRIACGLLAIAHPMVSGAATLWVGTYTADDGRRTGSEGIYAANWDEHSGVLGATRLVAATSNPSFLAADPTGRFLYSVNEDAAQSDRVSAYAIDSTASDALTSLGTVPSGGSAPCHLVVDLTGRWLFVANYLTGTLAVIPLGADGRPGAAVQVVQQSGAGPDRARQISAHAHQVLQSADGAYVLSVDLGADRVFVFRFDAASGHLTPVEAGPARLPPGYGPRHAVFSQDQRRLYVLTELVPAIVSFDWDAATGKLSRRAITPVLAGRFPRAGSGAEIVLHPSGRFIYASHRGATNTITSFRLLANGVPKRTGQVASGGIKPRYIGLAPDGRFLLSANQTSGDVCVFAIDQVDGTLSDSRGCIKVPGAVMVLFGTATPK